MTTRATTEAVDAEPRPTGAAPGGPLTPAAVGLAVAVVAGWAAAWALAALVGRQLGPDDMKMRSAPLFAHVDLRAGPGRVLAVAAGIAVAWVLVERVLRISWRALLGASAVGAMVWTAVLALTDPPHGFTRGVTNRSGHLASLSYAESPRDFLRDFTELVHTKGTVGVHVEGHPPLPMLVLRAMQAFGLADPVAVALVSLAGTGLAVVAVLVTVRSLSGLDAARRAAPFVAVAPAAIWLGSSDDALTAGVAASAVAAMALSTDPSRARPAVLAALSGLLVGAAMMLSYGMGIAAVAVAAVGFARRRVGAVFLAGFVALGVLLVFLAFGFDYLEGWRATHAAYVRGISSLRPQSYFVWANLVVWAIALGPGVLVGAAWLRGRDAIVPAAAAVVAVCASLLALSKGEVERIWLPITMFALAAGAGAWRGADPARTARVLLAGQVVFAIAVATVFRTPW